MNSKIFFRRLTAVWTVKTQRQRISWHLKNGSPTKSIWYKLVCEQNVFCYRDFRSYLKANHPRLIPFALKSTLAFEINWVIFSLLQCLLLPPPSSLLGLNFKSSFSLQRIFRCQIFPCEDLQLVVEIGVLVFAVLFHLHKKSLEIHQ